MVHVDTRCRVLDSNPPPALPDTTQSPTIMRTDRGSAAEQSTLSQSKHWSGGAHPGAFEKGTSSVLVNRAHCYQPAATLVAFHRCTHPFLRMDWDGKRPWACLETLGKHLVPQRAPPWEVPSLAAQISARCAPPIGASSGTNSHLQLTPQPRWHLGRRRACASHSCEERDIFRIAMTA